MVGKVLQEGCQGTHAIPLQRRLIRSALEPDQFCSKATIARHRVPNSGQRHRKECPPHLHIPSALFQKGLQALAAAGPTAAAKVVVSLQASLIKDPGTHY